MTCGNASGNANLIFGRFDLDYSIGRSERNEARVFNFGGGGLLLYDRRLYRTRHASF